MVFKQQHQKEKREVKMCHYYVKEHYYLYKKKETVSFHDKFAKMLCNSNRKQELLYL